MTEPGESNSPARMLYECLLEFGRQKSNPVLQVLAGEPPVGMHKYPPGDRLTFGTGGWRAFYHSHPTPDLPASEHGHFHLFAPVTHPDNNKAWTHVVALSMDNMGQPIRWFTVNRWVTAGSWLDANELASLIRTQQVAGSDPLLARWLAAMVALYSSEIEELLLERDRQLTGINDSQPGADILDNRDIYLVAETPVDLLAMLQTNLAGTNGVA
jgi:hypothetical protein